MTICEGASILRNAKVYLLFLQLVISVFLSQVLLAQQVNKLWSVHNIFKMPESAAYDVKRKQIYVSNVNGYAKDGNGFISRVSADGEELELSWLTGLNSPTGMSIYDNKLYVADYDALVIIEISKREIVAQIQAPDIKPSLNDVAISKTGQVFVSGSSSASIYMLKDNQLKVWKHDKHLLENANGLLVEENRLIHGG